jgi:hypothetical protein
MLRKLRRVEVEAPSLDKVNIMSFKITRYVYESAHCAIVTCDDGRSYMLGYFCAPRHAWTYVATFEEASAAFRAFEAYNCAVAVWRPASP